MPLLRLSTAAALLALAACAPDAADTADSGAGQPGAVASEPADQPTTAAVAPSQSAADVVPEAEKGETGARSVLLEWARDLERGDYDGAFATWGQDAETRSGMTRAEHAAYWQRFKTITVAMPTGTMDGAAGSLYYEAPTTVVGKQQNGTPYRLEGKVILKRVNDVDGATPDQLRWHMQEVSLADAS